MTAYEGDKIKLAPVSATYDVKVERVISEGQEGIAGIYKYYVGGSTYSSSDGINTVGYYAIEPFATNPNRYINGTSTLSGTFTTPSTYVDKAIAALNLSTGIKDIYTFSRDSNFLVATEKDGYYGIGAPLLYNQDTNDKKYILMLYTEYVHKGQPAIPAEVEYIDSPNTFVDKYGKLHIGKDLQVGDIIRIKSTSTYINPSGETETLEDTQSVVVI